MNPDYSIIIQVIHDISFVNWFGKRCLLYSNYNCTYRILDTALFKIFLLWLTPGLLLAVLPGEAGHEP